MTSNPPELSEAIAILANHVAGYVEKLRASHADPELIRGKVALERAIQVLKLADKLGLSGSEAAVVLPYTKVNTPSAQFRVIEDNESDAREWWTEVEVGGEPLRPYAGDIILSRP